ncbi:hypothetical protein [Novosphingobium meiothermophilum]|uniref:hypothetical protein n=1 Tax=Novosphingobium meiothermophilum TaxID=2202251 RepID=UPI000D6E10C7|nr:hypothetical protein [Novosphingobium meiothermophilum]
MKTLGGILLVLTLFITWTLAETAVDFHRADNRIGFLADLTTLGAVLSVGLTGALYLLLS